MDLGNVVAEFAGVASAMEIFGVSRYIAVPIAATAGVGAGAAGDVPASGEDFSGACRLYLAYVFSAILAKPDWLDAARHTVIPIDAFQCRLSADVHGSGGHDDCAVAIFYMQAGFVEKKVWAAAISAGASGRADGKHQLHGDRVFHHRMHGGDTCTLRASGALPTRRMRRKALVPLAGKWAAVHCLRSAC